MAVYIEGHAESLVHEAGRGERAVKGLTDATQKLEREQRTGTRGFASYSTATSKSAKSMRTLETAQGRAHRSMLAIGRGAAVAGAAIAAGLVVETKRSIEAYEESYKIGRQTNAVIKSTGGIANVTAGHVETLANAISLKSGIDDEAIQSASNMLLTFKNVRNETGEGNRIFDRATQVITDMSVAMGKDLKPTTIGVGKALQDPIKGISALSRVGVTFTEGQKKQIESLVESGKTMSAQKMILRELNSEFAGSAQAQATPMAKAKVAVENLEEALGKVLFPTFGKVAGGLAKFVNQIQSGTGAGGKFKGWVLDAAHAVGRFAGAVSEKTTSVVNSLRTFWKESGVTRAIVIGAFKAIKKLAIENLQSLIDFIKGWVQLIRGVVKVVSGVLTGDFGRAWDGVKDIFSGATKALLGMLRGITAPARMIIGKVGDGLSAGFKAMWGGIKSVFKSGVNDVVGLLQDLVDVITAIPGVPDIELPTFGGGNGGFKQKGSTGKGQGGAHRARGGPVRVGGKGREDTVPLYRGQIAAMVAPGEDLFVANRHQRPMLDAAVAAMYGVDGLDGFYSRYNRPHNLARGGQVPRFLSGGDVTGALGDAVKGTANTLTGGLAGQVLNTAKGAIAHLPKPHLPGWLGDLGGWIVSHVSNWIKSGFASGKLGSVSSSLHGTLSEAQFLRVAREALQITGHGGLPGGARKLLALARQESGLNADSINTTDSNAAAGNPSRGLMEITESNFRAYHQKGTSNSINDPLANIAASINYQFDRYGGLVTHSPYARGGLLQAIAHFASGGRIDAARRGMNPLYSFTEMSGGEQVNSSIAGLVAKMIRRFHMDITDALGSGHQSPGHTVTGTALDVVPSDGDWGGAFAKGLKTLTGMGFEVLYDGSLGTTSWPGHGPPSVAGDNAHAHIEMVGNGSAPDARKALREFLGGAAATSGSGEKPPPPATTRQKHRFKVLRKKAARLLSEVRKLKGQYAKRGGTEAGKRALERALKLAKAASDQEKIGNSENATRLIEEAKGELDKARGAFGRAKEGVYTPPLKDSPLEKAAAGLPPTLQAILSQPGITHSQKLAVGETAASLAGETTQPIFDEAGNEVSADSHADDIAAAKFQKPLIQADRKRIENALERIRKRLKSKGLTAKQRKRLLSEQSQLLDRIGSDTTALAGLNKTIHQKPDEPAESGESQTQQEILAAIEAQNALLKEQADRIAQERNLSQDQYATLKRAIADVAAGEIGGKVGLGFAVPTTPGEVVSL